MTWCMYMNTSYCRNVGSKKPLVSDILYIMGSASYLVCIAELIFQLLLSVKWLQDKQSTFQ